MALFSNAGINPALTRELFPTPDCPWMTIIFLSVLPILASNSSTSIFRPDASISGEIFSFLMVWFICRDVP